MMPFMVGQKRRTPTVTPTYRASSSAKRVGNPATALNVTIPASAQVGDLAIFFCAFYSPETVNTPAGLTKIYDTHEWTKSTNAAGNSTQAGLYVYTRWIESGDASSSFGFTGTGGGTRTMCAGVIVYSGVERIATHPMGTTKPVGSWATKLTAIPAMSTGPDNVLVGGFTTRSAANFNADNGIISSLDPDYTVRENQSDRDGILADSTGLVIFDGPVHGLVEEVDVSFREDSVVSWSCVMLELSGANAPLWTENERVPKSLQGKPFYCYGTSNTCMITRYDVDGGDFYPDEPKWTTQNSWPDWLQKIIDPNYLGNHMGVGGTNACDNVTFAFGSDVAPTRAASADLLWTDVCQINQVGTWKNQTNRDMGGLVMLDIFGNDILYEASPTAQVRDGVQIAADTMCRLLRSKHIRPYNYTGTTTSGPWVANNGPATSGALDSGTAYRSTQIGDTITIVTSEPHIDLLIMARDEANDPDIQGAANYSVKVDGVTVATGTTSNRLRLGNSAIYNSYHMCQMAIPLDLGGGSHTIVLTNEGPHPNSLWYQGYLVPKTVDAEIPWIVLMGMQKVAPPLDTNGAQAGMAAYLPIMQSVADQFPDGKVLVYDPMASGEWEAGPYMQSGAVGQAGVNADGAFTLDKIHMNNNGHAWFARDILRFLNERIP